MVAAAVIGSAVVGGVASMSAASNAASAQNHATDVAGSAADKQAALAQEQWDYQKNT